MVLLIMYVVVRVIGFDLDFDRLMQQLKQLQEYLKIKLIV